MNYNPIIIVAGEPNSVFIEIFLKSLNSKKFRRQIILICSHNLLKLQMKVLKSKKKINLLKINDFDLKKLDKKKINLIDVKYKTKKPFEKSSKKSKTYINECFKLALKLLKKKISNKFINGPISKKNFLAGKELGITEYLAKRTKTKKYAMLIYNKDLSVCPITTHVPLKSVSKKIKIKSILDKIKLIQNFYLKKLGKKPRIGVLGLNPHCESFEKHNEDERIIKPAIKIIKKRGYFISGPYPSDTMFLKNNRKEFDVIVGMYHDQVLTPIKTLYEYDAINITIGLPFVRISPDHGPNEKMMGKNVSNPLSLIKAISFLDKN